MTKILIISDDGISSGYGRISMEINRRLMQRGYQIMAASIYYDGLLPPTLDGQPLPYWVASLAGKPDWTQAVGNIASAFQPDIIHVTQDAPYAETLRNTPLDWSRFAFVVTTPVDGAPIAPNWVRLLREADGVLSISQFGVQAHRQAGIESYLCRPGIDANRFFRLPDDQRAALRQKLGLAPEAFVVMTAAQNQGRKDIPAMLQAFDAFAKDKPTARYLLDMDAISPAGWNLLDLCAMYGWDASKLIFRADMTRAGMVDLRDRYNLADAHMVISHREGYGLPLVEAMACGVVSMALDYCSGTEIVGDGKGILIRPLDYASVSTWGGALDKHPDLAHLQQSLQCLYDHPDERRAMAQRGMAWARQQTWDAAADAVQQAYERALMKRKTAPKEREWAAAIPHVPSAAMLPSATTQSKPEPVLSALADDTPVMSVLGVPVAPAAPPPAPDGLKSEALIEVVG